MDDLWQRVEQLVGQELLLIGSARRAVHVLAVDADTVVLQGIRRGRLPGDHAGHQVSRADIEAAARLGLHGTALQLFTLRQQLSELPQPGYILAILRALEPADIPPVQ
jgi:hypothetical protein